MENKITFDNIRSLSTTAKQILNKRYMWEGEKTWDELVTRVVSYIVPKDNKDFAPTQEMIMHRYFLPNSPCLANAGKEGAGLCACYVVDFPDTTEGIIKTKADFIYIARKGGGCGTSLSKLRPKGSLVRGSSHGYAGGPIGFSDTISHDMKVFTQGGLRPMAIMFTISVYHPDIMEFILAKENEEDKRIENANMSVVVDSQFMELVKNNKTYWTEFNGIKYKEYNASDIFDLIVEGAWRNGEPGILFQDTINDSPYKYTDQKIQSVNPCLHKDVLLPSENKLIRISKPNNGFTSWKTGKKKCIKLTTNAGHEIILTPDHKIMQNNGEFIEAKNSLNKSISWALGNLDGMKFLFAQVLGFLFGDGFLCGDRQGVSVKLNKEIESEIYNILIKFGFHEENCGSLYCNKKFISELLANNLDFLSYRTFDRDIPENILLGDASFLSSFISGLFEANGSVTVNNQISLKSTNKKQVRNLQIALSAFGIESWIVKNKPFLIHWHNGDYTSRESYNLQIAPRNAFKFKEKIGFISNKKNNKIKKLFGKYNSKLKVVSIEDVGIQEVWDFSNEIHYSLANGIYVHNCAEQPLPPNGVCNLGSLDLSKFVNKNEETDFNKLECATRLGVRFLDRVVDKSSYPTLEIAEWAKDNRAIGIGIMGFADFCLMKKIAYGSDESLQELDTILSKIYSWSKNESEKLGQEFGIPKECKKLPEPRRNITLTTVAPTGTVSLIAGASSGIEPVFSEVVVRNDKTGTYVFEDKLADKPYFRCAVSSNGATEVTWEEHVKVLATAQKNVDSGVSKTINFPNHTHRETIHKAIFMAWELGCKGIAVYRNGSRKLEVLTPKNIKQDKCPNCGGIIATVDNVKKCLSCDWRLKL